MYPRLGHKGGSDSWKPGFKRGGQRRPNAPFRGPSFSDCSVSTLAPVLVSLSFEVLPDLSPPVALPNKFIAHQGHPVRPIAPLSNMRANTNMVPDPLHNLRHELIPCVCSGGDHHNHLTASVVISVPLSKRGTSVWTDRDGETLHGRVPRQRRCEVERHWPSHGACHYARRHLLEAISCAVTECRPAGLSFRTRMGSCARWDFAPVRLKQAPSEGRASDLLLPCWF